jgi:hypothetical protein
MRTGMMVMSRMARKNVPKKVAKKQHPQTWDKKLKTLRKRYQQPPKGGRKENTLLPFHMPNVVVGGRLKSHILGGESK